MSDPVTALVVTPTTHAERAASLMEQAKHAASAHANEWLDTLKLAAELSREIAGGGEAYPPAIREMAGRCCAQLSGMVDGILKVGA